MNNTKVYYGHGKLLLTGEYLVLDGAKAIALPCSLGQYLTVKPLNEPALHWKSYDADGALWFEHQYTLQNKTIVATDDSPVATTLIQLLETAQRLNPNFLTRHMGYEVTTQLTFSRALGLGSSSTLLYLIGQWAKINPFTLSDMAFGGSGYDIACAGALQPIAYKRINNQPHSETVSFNPSFKSQLYFVYLNEKQNSREGIKHYKNLNSQLKSSYKQQIDRISNDILSCDTIDTFNALIDEHEALLSDILQLPTVKARLFSDYSHGSIKSLGAWGGDFILVTATSTSDLDYFRSKGYPTIYSYNDLIL